MPWMTPLTADIQALGDTWYMGIANSLPQKEKLQGFTIFLPKNKKLSVGQNAQ